MSADRVRKSRMALICALCTALVLSGFLAARRFEAFAILVRREMLFRDFLANHGRKNPPDPRLVFIGVDNESVSLDEVDLNSLFADVPREGADFQALTLMSRQWPWSREVYALVLDKLCGAGARVVVFDLMFPKASANDEGFRAALDRYRDRVVVGSNFVPQTLPDGMEAWAHAQPTASLIPSTRPLDPRCAFVNFWPDGADEEIRRARFRATAEHLTGRSPGADSEVFLSVAARAVTQAGLGGLVPAGPDADWPFVYTAAPGSGFRPLSIYQLFVPKYWDANFAKGAVFRDKIVVIGPSGNWQHDEHPTPLGKMPGPELQLNAINALLHRAFLTEAPLWVNLVLVVICGLGGWLAMLLSRRPTLQVLYLLLGNAIAVGLALVAYNYLDLVSAVVGPLVAFNLSGGACFVYDFVAERMDKARTRRTLERYVSKDVVRELLDNRESLLHALGGSRRFITILFSDLRGFTTLTETSDAAALLAQLNEYFQRMVRVVFANHGTIDKFMGDGLMAHWGSIVSAGERVDAGHAVRAALQMRGELAQLNKSWKERGLPTLEFGIGINSGEVIVGNIGSEEKMEVSIVGDPANLASRVEGATKQYHSDLLIGESVARLVDEAFYIRAVDLLRVKGRARSLEVFNVLGERTPGNPEPVWLAEWVEIMQEFRARNFTRVLELCDQLAGRLPDDWLVKEYRQRAEVYAKDPPAPDWDGVTTLSQK